MTMVDCCQRPAFAYLTTKRATVDVSATPVARPNGVQTVAELPALFEQKILFRILMSQRRVHTFWRPLPMLFFVPALMLTEGAGIAREEIGSETRRRK